MSIVAPDKENSDVPSPLFVLEGVQVTAPQVVRGVDVAPLAFQKVGVGVRIDVRG
jgi:hypothetical protein